MFFLCSLLVLIRACLLLPPVSPRYCYQPLPEASSGNSLAATLKHFLTAAFRISGPEAACRLAGTLIDLDILVASGPHSCNRLTHHWTHRLCSWIVHFAWCDLDCCRCYYSWPANLQQTTGTTPLQRNSSTLLSDGRRHIYCDCSRLHCERLVLSPPSCRAQ